MIKFYHSSRFSAILIACTFMLSVSSFFTQAATSCDVYMNAGPLTRATTYGEEQVVSGIYEAVAQQYNGVSGQINSVIFWGRVNPASGSANNTLKVVIYQVNLGLPGTILGSQNVVVDSASSNYLVTATFSSPVAVSGDIIISIEPFAPSTDNFFIQHNASPDGQMLNLIKLKQASQWFKDLAAGDPSFDYDFMILPVSTVTLTAGFSYGASGNTTNFTNTSTSASSYYWDFGDGDTSTAISPSHNYAASANYNVTLKAYANGISSSCVDSITTSVNVVITGTQQMQAKKNGFVLTSNVVQDVLIIDAYQNGSGVIVDILGNQVAKFEVKQNQKHQIKIDQLRAGIYLINSTNQKSIRFIKTN